MLISDPLKNAPRTLQEEMIKSGSLKKRAQQLFEQFVEENPFPVISLAHDAGYTNKHHLQELINSLYIKNEKTINTIHGAPSTFDYLDLFILTKEIPNGLAYIASGFCEDSMLIKGTIYSPDPLTQIRDTARSPLIDQLISDVRNNPFFCSRIHFVHDGVREALTYAVKLPVQNILRLGKSLLGIEITLYNEHAIEKLLEESTQKENTTRE